MIQCMRFSGLLCGIRAKICSEKTWFKFVTMSAFNIPSPCPLPQEGGEVRAAALDLLGASPLNPVRDCCAELTGATAPSPSKDACSQPHKSVMQGCIKTATQSRCTMQRHKWLSLHRCNGTNGCHCTDATAQMADDLYGCFAPNPVWLSTVCLTYKINYSIIRGKMQVKFSGENHVFLWQNVKS